jgi:hypothetical protein
MIKGRVKLQWIVISELLPPELRPLFEEALLSPGLLYRQQKIGYPALVFREMWDTAVLDRQL